MKELKFRQAKCNAKGEFVEWFYWGFLEDISGRHFVAPLQHNVENFQFTGLTDKKRTKEYPEGQEIYEGDIVRLFDDTTEYCVNKYQMNPNRWTFIVSFENACFGYHGAIKEIHCSEDIEFRPIYNYEDREISWTEPCVIGNIHQNPELLKNENN